jgi:pimeloyl-ACP methyl ester carboxylesterase
MKFFASLLLAAAACTSALVTERTEGLVNGLKFDYPYPVLSYRFTSQRKQLTMSYMDVSPKTTPKGNIVLLHGKNFCGATWNTTIKALVDDGYRVVVPDQVGFCKSTKPSEFQFTLFALAQHTNGLLTKLGITSAVIMGHSMGGMLAARYALMYPAQTSRLVMVAPLGLENWFAKGVPYQNPEISYQSELATTRDSLKAYQLSTYYVGQWKPEYDIWIDMLWSLYQNSNYFAWNMASTTDMVFTQPVIDELPNLKMPSLLISGDKDTTAIGSKWAPADIKAKLGHYDVLAPEVSAKIPGNTLIRFATLGHAPQISNPDLFHEALLGWLP